jgi:transposase-like protein
MTNEAKSRQMIADTLGITRKTLWNWMHKIEEETGEEFTKRDLLTPREWKRIYNKYGIEDNEPTKNTSSTNSNPKF